MLMFRAGSLVQRSLYSDPKRGFSTARHCALCAQPPTGRLGLHNLEYRENCSAGGIHVPLDSG